MEAKMKKILLGIVLIISSQLSAANYSPSWWTGTNGSNAGNPNGLWQLDRFCASNVTPSTATPTSFTRAFYTVGSTYDTTTWSGDNDWPHAFAYAGHSNTSSVDEISLIFYKSTDGIDQAGHHMSLTFVAPTAGTYSISGSVDYCGIYNGAPSTMKGLDVIIFKYADGAWTRSDQLTLYSSSSSVLHISPSSPEYYSGNTTLPNGVALNAGDYITFRPWAWDRGYFYQANMDDILVSNVASFTLPDGNWPAGADATNNPYAQWAVKLQAPGAGYTSSYTLAGNNYWTIPPGDAGYYNWGMQYDAGVQSHNGSARTYTWNDSLNYRFGCIEFTVPDGWNGENAVVTGTTSNPSGSSWNNVEIYRLNAAGTRDREIFLDSMCADYSDIDVNVPVCSGDRIIYRSSTVYQATPNFLEDYQIKLVGWDVPWFEGTNQYVDPMHNTWAVYETTSDDSSNWSSYDQMTWNSNGLWVGPSGYPSYKSPGHRCISSVDLGGGTDYITALAYTPWVSGRYSWTGKIKNGDPNGSSSCIVHFGKFNASNVYTLLKSVTVLGSSTVNLKFIPELQGVNVNHNEKLVVFAVANINSTAQIYFGPNDDPAGIKPLVVSEVRNVKDFGAVGNGVADDTNAIQAAISYSPGLIYFPSGTYLVSHEIKVWGDFGGTHLIGDYSGTRPKILLAANTPGYNNPNNLAYVIRFYKSAPPDPCLAWDTTFDSALDGIDIEVESGNTGAVALSHKGNLPGYVRNCEITLSADSNLGMEWLPGASITENVTIDGGKIGIRIGAGQAPSSLRGCTFKNQTVASVDVYQTGLVFTGCDFNNVAIGIRTPTYMGTYPAARLYLEDCIFRNITGNKAIVGEKAQNGSGTGGSLYWYWVLALKNVYFKDVNEIAYWEAGGGVSAVSIAGQLSGWCRADYVTHGRRWANGDKLNDDGEDHREVTNDPSPPTYTASDFVLAIPNKSDCVSVKDYGAYGDGIHDDTAAINYAISQTNNIFFPMGTYKISNTITLDKDSKLIGEHCKYTTIKLIPNSGDNSFNNSGSPKPMIYTVDDASGAAVFSGFNLGKYVDVYDGLITICWRVGANSIIDAIYGLNYVDDIAHASGYCGLKITGQGGGNIRHAWFPWDYCSGPGSIIIEGTNQPLYLAGVCAEHDTGKTSVYINQSQNITFRTLCDETSYCIVDANNSNNLIFNDVLYNGDNGGVDTIALKFNNCNNVEVYSYWRLDAPGQYYDYGISYNGNMLTDGGNLPIAAYRWGPGLASAPTPANAATGVSLTPTLSWTSGGGTAYCYVYFGTDSTPDDTEYKGNQSGTTYNPGTLANNITYYWRIDEVGSGGVTTGTVWSFTTIKAAPAFQAAGTAQSGTGNITVPWPTHQTGDVALLFIESCGGQAANLGTPAGFAAVTNSPQYTGSGTAGTRITVYWCRATSSSMASPVVTDPGDHVYGRILTFRGVVASGNPWDVTAGGAKASASTTTTFGTVTPTVSNALIVLAASRDNDSASAAWSSWTNANLSSLAERSDEGTTQGNGGGIGLATGIKVTAGAIG